MQLGALLGTLIAQKDKSKNNIIKEIGIDRSSFYKILKGDRRVTEDQLKRFVRAMELDKEDLERVLNAYEEEQAGEQLYVQRSAVRSFLNGLSEGTGDVSPIEALLRFVQRETEAGTDKYRVFLPIGSRCMTELFTRLGTTGVATPPEICALLANEEPRGADILQELSNWFPYLRAQTVHFHAYTLWETTRGLEALPFPYYILGEHSILLISSDEKRFIETQEPLIVEAYRENYEVQIAKGLEVASTETEFETILQFFIELWQGALESQEEVYLLTPRPCLYMCSTDEMVRKYMHKEEFVQYGQMIRELNMREFTTRSGMQRFLDECRICEAGFDTPVTIEDMEGVQQRIIRQNECGRTFFLNEERIHLPQDWQLFIIANRMAVFVPFKTSTYIMCATSSAVVEPLTEWCESRAREWNNDVLSE